MKVILAGCPKTGTKPLVEVFRKLGYTVYDYQEHYWYLSRQWLKIFRTGGTVEDFREMYEGVDVVSDVPACYFWEQISLAYPEAKIILMVRENEDVWWESIANQVSKFKTSIFSSIILLSPTAIHNFHYTNRMLRVIYGSQSVWPWKPYTPNPLVTKLFYARQNSHVLQNAPKERLLVYNLKDGWEPLCSFLKIDEPDYPFPHKHGKGEQAQEAAMNSLVFQRIKKEIQISFLLGAVIVGTAAFWQYRQRVMLWC